MHNSDIPVPQVVEELVALHTSLPGQRLTASSGAVLRKYSYFIH